MRPDCVLTWSEIRADCVRQMDEQTEQIDKHVYRSFNSVYDLAVAKNSWETRFLKSRNGRTDRRMDRRTDRRTDGPTDEQTLL